MIQNKDELLAALRDRSAPAHGMLSLLFDEGEYTELSAGCEGRGGQTVITAYGYANGTPVYAFAQNSAVSGGAVDAVHAAKIAHMFDLAARNGMPVVGIYDSHGAFTDDGVTALDSYSLMLGKITELSGTVPTISVITGVCSGSMSLAAASADLVAMTADAELYLEASSPYSAAAAAENGTAHITADTAEEIFEKVKRYISLMPQNDLSPVPEYEYDLPAECDFSDAANAAASIADAGSVFELSPDFGGAAYTALCTIDGVTAGITAINKTRDKLMPHDLQKIARFVRLCDAYGIAVVTVADSEGIADKGCAARSLVRLAGAYSEAVCPKITVISGKACGVIFTAFAGKNVAADMTIALPDAVIAPLEPLTAAEFLYHDRLAGVKDTAAAREEIAKEYALTEASPFNAAKAGTIDCVTDAAGVRAAVSSALEFSAGKRLLKRLPKKHSVLC